MARAVGYFGEFPGRLTARSTRLAPECVSGGFAWRSKRVRSMSTHSATPALSAVTLCGPKSWAINPVASVTRAGADSLRLKKVRARPFSGARTLRTQSTQFRRFVRWSFRRRSGTPRPVVDAFPPDTFELHIPDRTPTFHSPSRRLVSFAGVYRYCPSSCDAANHASPNPSGGSRARPRSLPRAGCPRRGGARPGLGGRNQAGTGRARRRACCG